jgi:hypothetical protein
MPFPGGHPSEPIETPTTKQPLALARQSARQGSGTNWNVLRASHGISARKKRYVMTQIHELIDQPCDDPLSASVKLRGRTFR